MSFAALGATTTAATGKLYVATPGGVTFSATNTEEAYTGAAKWYANKANACRKHLVQAENLAKSAR